MLFSFRIKDGFTLKVEGLFQTLIKDVIAYKYLIISFMILSLYVMC